MRMYALFQYASLEKHKQFSVMHMTYLTKRLRYTALLRQPFARYVICRHRTCLVMVLCCYVHYLFETLDGIQRAELVDSAVQPLG